MRGAEKEGGRGRERERGREGRKGGKEKLKLTCREVHTCIYM